MKTFLIWDMFRKIGEVEITEAGLYYAYTAFINSGRTEFLRLYCHREDKTTSLGVFIWEDGRQYCSGRISKKTMGIADELVRFSIQKTPFFPLKTPLDGGYLPPNALYNPQKGRRFVAICHENDLPFEVLPYFCFLRPNIICGTSCMVFDVDLSGKPVIPEQIKG